MQTAQLELNMYCMNHGALSMDLALNISREPPNEVEFGAALLQPLEREQYALC